MPARCASGRREGSESVGLFRRRRLPAGARPPLADDERILAWAGATGDAVVVVSNLGLWLPGISGATRLGWHEIHKAVWSGRALQVVPASEVTTHETYAEMVDADSLTVTLLDPDKVPEQVRARVTRSVAYTSHHPLWSSKTVASAPGHLMRIIPAPSADPSPDRRRAARES